MKKISLKRPIIVMFLVSAFASASSPVFAASVSSMINRGISQNEAGESIYIVDVKCSVSSAEPKLIINKVGEAEWCSKDIPTLCARNKISSANRVCRSGFLKKVEEYNNSLSPQESVVDAPIQDVDPSASGQTEELTTLAADDQALLNEAALEKERINIERQKLQIRRQELELNKRRLELERQSASGQ